MFRNGFYNLIGGATRVAVTLVTIPILLRIVGIEEYGLLTVVLTVVNLVTLAEAGLPIATTVFVSRDRAGQNSTALSQTLTVCLLATLLLATAAAAAIWFGSHWVARMYPNLSVVQGDILAQSLRFGAVVVWVRLLQQVLIGVEQAYLRYGVMNVLSTAQAVLSNLGMLLIAGLGGRSSGLIAWQALVGCVIAVLHAGFCARLLFGLRLRWSWNAARAREIAAFSGYAWMSSFGSALFTQCDRLIVGALLGLGPLGLYGAITSATTQINNLSSLVVQPLMPAISAGASLHELDSDAVRMHLKRAWQTLAFIAFGLGGALLVLAPLLLRLASPELFTALSANQFRLAAVIYALYSMNAFGYFVLLGTERAHECMLIILASGLISLLLITLGASSFGLTGAVAGNLGFLATLSLNTRSLRGLPASQRDLLQWIRMPLIWFAAVVAVALLAPDRNSVLVFLFLMQSALLGVWYLAAQRFDPRLDRLLAAARKAHP